jgi:RNA polymerase sigma factor (sigma-70 family)
MTELKYLFQQEFARMVAVISKLYGLQHIEIAEDIVSETFLQATETWAEKGMPPNPAAWLYAVAKQKTLYYFRRNKIFDEKVKPGLMHTEQTRIEPAEPDFSNENIRDSQLQMLFAICTPSIASEAQIGLALRILCGFGIEQIADAFLSNKETINKRLFRAKEKLRSEKIELELPPANEISARLDNVLHIIYLLFNEGYYSITNDQILQKDLCFEAMRLGMLLTTYDRTNLSNTNALLALMCFHASRFDARQRIDNNIILYDKQDETLWNKELIAQGKYFLSLSADGDSITSYHLEARIAYWHCIKEDTAEKWEDILQAYNQLLLINYSPSVALNRTYALYKANGRKEALAAAEKLQLEHNHFYFLLLAELYKTIDPIKVKAHLEKALSLAKTTTEQESIRQQLAELAV